ncbi:hypothetical protein FCN77_13315 [Arthrobacter sp. 24S4-2]|nr:hypothetical protein FCN77_13315 [Arthrobacter sp. 24S4-2]
MGHVPAGTLLPLAGTPVVAAPDPLNAVALSDRAAITAELTAVDSDGGTRRVLLEPFAGIHNERYTVYWPTARAASALRSSEHWTRQPQRRVKSSTPWWPGNNSPSPTTPSPAIRPGPPAGRASTGAARPAGSPTPLPTRRPGPPCCVYGPAPPGTARTNSGLTACRCPAQSAASGTVRKRSSISKFPVRCGTTTAASWFLLSTPDPDASPGPAVRAVAEDGVMRVNS